MRKYRFVLTGCLLLVSAACIAVSLQNIEVPAFDSPDLSKLKSHPVLKIINSNTITILMDGNDSTICLLGVDGLPLNSADATGQAGRFLTNLLKAESVFVLFSAKQADSNSIEAYVYRSPDGLFVNEEVLRQGFGLAASKSPHQYTKQFHRLELFARQAEKGIWANKSSPQASEVSANTDEPNKTNKPQSKPINNIKPAADNLKVSDGETTVYVTKSGTKYHSKGCRSLSKSSIPMKLKEAKIRYSPCKICKPPE